MRLLSTALISLLITVLPAWAISAGLSSDQIVSICNSQKEIYLIDVFKNLKPTFGYQQDEALKGEIDVDGDGVHDILHGDFVAKIFELNNRPLKTYGMKGYGKTSVQGALGDLRYFIRSKQIPVPGAIIMAMSHSFSIEKIKIELLRDKKIDLNFSNIHLHSDKIIQAIKDNYGDSHMLYSFFKDVQDLNKLGVPVMVASGNDYSTKVNLASLMGTTSIGARDLNNKVAAYSNENSYVSVYRPGDFIGRKIIGGVDINNDGVADFSQSELSGGQSLASIYKSKKVELLDIKDVGKNLDNEFFISSRNFNLKTGVNSEATLSLFDATYGDISHYPSNMSFFTQRDGSLLFNPAGDNSLNQVSINYGTSFAIGNLCIQ